MTGRPLFLVPWYPTQQDQDDNHLNGFISILGPLPDELYKHWNRYLLYFTPERKLYNCQLGGVPKGEEPLMLTQLSMEEMFDEAEPDVAEEEAKAIKLLIRRILQWANMA